MKNKKNIYILLPLVIIIWGLIGFKIFSGLNSASFNEKSSKMDKQFVPKTVDQAKAFTIDPDYRDPFLGTFKKKKAIVKKTSNAIAKKTVVFPTIVYKGMIAPKSKNKKVFMLAINGKQYLFKRNSVFEGVQLLKGNTQEVVLQYQKQEQTFQLEK